MKFFTYLIMLFSLLYSISVIAGESSYIPVEVPAKLIKLSNDGTGVVQKVSCQGCDYTFVRITANTRAFVNNVETDRRNVRTTKQRIVLVKFNRETGEVAELRWVEK